MINRIHLTTAFRWLTGFGISLFAIWGITAVCTENFYPETWDPQLQRNLPAAGWSSHYRSESWARSDFGKRGMAGVEDIDEDPLPKIIIWGDSFVQASQVDDEYKMHSQLTRMLAEDDGPPLTALSVGHNWWSLPDFYYHIPNYENTIADCKLHVIHLFTLEDTFPDRNPNHRVSLFLSEPDLHFEKYDNEFREIEPPATHSSLRNALFRARLHFFLRTKKKVFEIARLQGLRFTLGTQSADSSGAAYKPAKWSDKTQPEWLEKGTPPDAWRFALKSLKEAATVPVLFVYAPATPAIHNGTIVEKNAEHEAAQEFAKLCAEYGIGFVSLEEKINEHWQASGKLPRGFSTLPPGEGHYNPLGHQLTAEAIQNWIRRNGHVVHPD